MREMVMDGHRTTSQQLSPTARTAPQWPLCCPLFPAKSRYRNVALSEWIVDPYRGRRVIDEGSTLGMARDPTRVAARPPPESIVVAGANGISGQQSDFEKVRI